MKLLHTSDWHLGMTFRGGISYDDDQRYMIDQICKVAVKEKVEGILLAGDVFDKGIASQDALKLYDETMTRICGEMKIPIYMIAGNHDGAKRLSSCNKLLANSGLHIVGELTDYPQYVTADDVDIYFLPWISTDKVKSLYDDEIESLEDAYRIVLNKYKESFNPNHKHILISHAYITNAELSVSDRAAEVGQATMVSASVFDGFDYVALGHLHGPQKINDHIRYSGTPMAYSFGREEKQEKSVTIIDTDNMDIQTVVLPQLHKRTTLTGKFSELMSADYDEDVLNGYVRAEVTDIYVGLEGMSDLRERFVSLLEVSSKGFEKEDAVITMTIEEFENAGSDPQTIFARFCEDILEEAPGEHFMTLFKNALEEYERGAGEE